MLVPALAYKEDIEKAFAWELYEDNYFYYCGYPSTEIPEIKTEENRYQYAILDKDGYLTGYFTYRICPATDTVGSFGLYAFRPSTVLGKDIYKKMRELIKIHRRIEWRMIGGNKVQPTYDHLCRKFGGNKVVLHDVCKDIHGNYHDEHIYEIVRK